MICAPDKEMFFIAYLHSCFHTLTMCAWLRYENYDCYYPNELNVVLQGVQYWGNGGGWLSSHLGAHQTGLQQRSRYSSKRSAIWRSDIKRVSIPFIYDIQWIITVLSVVNRDTHPSTLSMHRFHVCIYWNALSMINCVGKCELASSTRTFLLWPGQDGWCDVSL